ncbi:MAG: glycosyltransferase [Actinomycetota bacterium]|nr:glycosyltransferase [Actinomycetota bacterium]
MFRLARDRRVFYVEEPIFEGDAEPFTLVETRAPGVTRIVPWFAEGYVASVEEPVSMVRQAIEEAGVTDPVAWIYAPTLMPYMDALPAPRAVVYDCMDELSAFAGMHDLTGVFRSGRELLAEEARLLELADVVFAGGRSMHEARADRHDNIHLFPSSVDTDHYRSATRKETQVPDDTIFGGAPVLGYFGSVDERIDLALLDRVAAAHPEWHLVMLGPVNKIDPAVLPQRENIHYPGFRSYEELPAYLKGWDVCLMPFTMNEATRSISPTKTLEYLAADKPVVSTPVPDVVAEYSGLVAIAETDQGFATACEKFLGESEEERRARIARAREVLSRTSWDTTAERMARLIDEAARARGADSIAQDASQRMRG